LLNTLAHRHLSMILWSLVDRITPIALTAGTNRVWSSLAMASHSWYKMSGEETNWMIDSSSEIKTWERIQRQSDLTLSSRTKRPSLAI
jgi:hypothetical protein